MSRPKRPGPRSHPRSIRRLSALERLTERVDTNAGRSDAELIRLLRQAYFADVDALAASGTVKLPDYDRQPRMNTDGH